MTDLELLKCSGLKKTTLNRIIRTILHHKSVDKIILFGSRAQNKSNKTSDIDIAIYGNNWTSTDINLVYDKLEENISTIFQFDVLHYNSLRNDILKKEINKGITLYHA